MQIINIEIKNRIASNPDVVISCGTDYQIAFTFDSEWNGIQTKKARFSWNGTYKDVTFNGNVVDVPKIKYAKKLVVSVCAGELKTITPSTIGCSGGTPEDPDRDDIEQLIALSNQALATARSVEERANNGEFDGEKGDKGDRGERGERGEQGIQGERGERGEKGETGEAGKDGKDGKDGYTPIKGVDYFTEAEIEEVGAEATEHINTTFANSLKGTAKGEVIALKDISSVEHNLNVTIERKNLFDVSKIVTSASVINNNDGTVLVKGAGGQSTGRIFGELCTDLKVGDTFTITLRSITSVADTKDGCYIYVVGYGTLTSHNTYTATEEMINGLTYVYKAPYAYQDQVTEGIVSEIQVELGTTATPYTPFVADIESVKVIVRGENLYDVLSVTDCVNSNGSSNGGYREDDILYNPIGVYGNGSYFKGTSLNFDVGWYHISADVFATLPETGSIIARFYNPDTKTYSANPAYQEINLNEWTHLNWRVSIETANEYYLMLAAGGNASNYNKLDARFKNIMITKEVVWDEYPPYEPFKGLWKYSQDEDIKSIYPNTIIETDKAGVLMSVEYNKDANKVVASLEERLSALEALIVSQ